MFWIFDLGMWELPMMCFGVGFLIGGGTMFFIWMLMSCADQDDRRMGRK